MSNVGKFIKEKRERALLTQKKLGTACGVSDSEICKIENGERQTPSWDTLCKIARALTINPIEIMLVAGYITEEDIEHPACKLHGVESLNDNELEVVQTFIDFMHYNRREGTGKERGCNHEI